jgi:hypothetical protein
VCAYIDCMLACVCDIDDEVNEGRYPKFVLFRVALALPCPLRRRDVKD